LNNLIVQLDERNQLSEADLMTQPSIFVIMTELDRVDDLRRSNEQSYSPESHLTTQIKRLLKEGPTKGIHLILSFSGIKAFSNVLDIRRNLAYFRHRVALQMSEDDSFTFVSDRQASRLQADGDVPIKALYRDTDSDRTTLFKPYSTESTPEFKQQIEKIANSLIKRA
jgi:S-DNA-T family DNA segregation ATPase FtsK/SpoIIIE